MKKRVWSILLALVMVLGLLPAAAFAADLPFTDVPKNAWYYNDVKNAVASGLVNGKNGTTYAPNDNLTYAEAVKLAACMYQKSYEGIVTLKNGSPWYQSYVDYAYLNGIISRDYDWNAKATRAGYMEIFACALTPDDLAPMNQVADDAIPDVRMTHPQAAAIYSLYRAGILQGGDAIGSCKPNDNIKRSEVAAILTRMMDPAKRVSFQLGEAGALTISAQPRALVLDDKDSSGSLTVTATGGKLPYSYQWYKEEGSIKLTDGSLSPAAKHASVEGSATNKLTFRDAPQEGGFAITGTYYCVVKDATGKAVTSDRAKVAVNAEEALTISQQPQPLILANGFKVGRLSVTATGGKAPYSYQWFRANGNAVTDGTFGAGKAQYAFSGSETAELEVSYGTSSSPVCDTYFCVITDAAGEYVVSEAASVSVADDSSSYTKADFLMYVEDIFKITGRGFVLSGRIQNGSVEVGDYIKALLPFGNGGYTMGLVQVQGIEMFRKTLDSAEKGDNVGIAIGSDSGGIEEGCVLLGDGSTYPIITKMHDLTGDFVMKSKEDGGKYTPISAGYRPQIYLPGKDQPCTFADLNGGEINPGESRLGITVNLSTPTVVWVGQQLSIREAGREVGTFTITDIS